MSVCCVQILVEWDLSSFLILLSQDVSWQSSSWSQRSVGKWLKPPSLPALHVPLEVHFSALTACLTCLIVIQAVHQWVWRLPGPGKMDLRTVCSSQSTVYKTSCTQHMWLHYPQLSFLLLCWRWLERSWQNVTYACAPLAADFSWYISMNPPSIGSLC